MVVKKIKELRQKEINGANGEAKSDEILNKYDNILKENSKLVEGARATIAQRVKYFKEKNKDDN